MNRTIRAATTSRGPIRRGLRALHLLCFIAVGIAFAGCPEDPVSPEPEPPPYNEYALDSAVAVILPEGGTIAINDGGTVAFGPGAVNAPTTVTVKKIGGDRYFDAPNRWIYEIAGADGVPMTVTFPGKPGRTNEQVGVLRYNHETFESEELPFLYNPSTGSITVDIPRSATAFSGGGSGKRSGWTATRLAAEADDLITPEQEEVMLTIPYYEQDYQTCWATTAKMLSEAYNWSASDVNLIPQYIKDLGTDHLTGINHIDYWYKLPKLLARATGRQTQALWCWRSAPARDKLVEQLGKGVPVSMALNLPDHSVNVIGYRKTSGVSGAVTYDFLIHDPQNASGMNEWHAWSWFEARKPTRYSFQLIWFDQAPPTNRPLQSVGFPMGVTGSIGLQHIATDCDGNQAPRILGAVTFQKDAAGGYVWKDVGGKKLDRIPGEATHLALDIPMWNSSAASATVQLVLKLARKGAAAYLYNQTFTVTLPAQSATHKFEQTIPVFEPRDRANPTEYVCTVELHNAAGKIDGYSFSYILEPAKPVITRIFPCSGGWGTEVTITGTGFGASYNPATASVLFDNTPATQVTGWSDTEIRVRVPQGAATGDVLVVVEGAVSNGLLFEVESASADYTFKPFSFSGFPFNDGQTISCAGSISASNMVIDDDYNSVGFQVIGFTITGTPPVSLTVKRTAAGINTSRETPWDDTTTLKTIWELKDYVLRYKKPDGVSTGDVVSAGGTFNLTLNQQNLGVITDGIWTFNADVLVRYTVTEQTWVKGTLRGSTSRTEEWMNLLLVGFVNR